MISLAVLAALAVLDLGARAAAAYVPAGDVTSATVAVESFDDAQDQQDGEPVVPVLSVFVEGGGGMSSPPSGGATSAAPPVGNLIGVSLVDDIATSFLRERAMRIPTSYFIDSLLDPPRVRLI